MTDLLWIRAALERYERPLLSYAVRFTGDSERARDAVQESFMKLCSQDRSALEDRLAEWLFLVCRNICIDQQRKERSMHALDESSVETAPSRGDPAAALEHKDQSQRALVLLEALPQKQREVLRLKFQQGLSYKEIAGITGDSLGNVGWLIHMGLKALRARMATAHTAEELQ